jgi:glucosylceramidase
MLHPASAGRDSTDDGRLITRNIVQFTKKDPTMLSTRRGFVMGALGTVALAPLHARARTGGIEVWQTAGSDRFRKLPSLSWRVGGEGAGPEITLDPTTSFQEILGFGAAFTEASAYVINRLARGARERFLHELFSPSELGINVARICIGSSDFATAMFSYDEGAPDPDLQRFSIDRDRAYVLPGLLSARQLNPDLFLLASPWSPPGWMKNGGSMLGGNIKAPNLEIYAKYLVKFLEAYRAAGIRVDAITSQNEVDTDQGGRMPASVLSQENEISLVGGYLGPAIAAAGLPTRIWVLDHNFNLWGRVLNTLQNSDVYKYADGVAWHPYVGSPESMTRIHDAFPTKGMYWTEGGFELGAVAASAGAPPAESDANTAITLSALGATNALRNWARCLIDWNVALDENGGPNIGPFHLKGTTTIDSKSGEVSTRGPNYWIIKHLNHAARRGAMVIESSGGIDGLFHVAFVNTDGRNAMMLTNTGPNRAVTIRNGAQSVEVALPATSVTNLHWT